MDFFSFLQLFKHKLSVTTVTITYSQTQCGTLITIIIAKAMYKTIARPYILHYRKCCITVHYRKCGIRLHHNNYITKCMHLESVYICDRICEKVPFHTQNLTHFVNFKAS